MQTSLSGITIHPMVEADLSSAWTLRLRALREHPDAFGQPYTTVVNYTTAQVQEEWDNKWNHGDNRVFVAVDADGRLLGMTGIAREHIPKMRHRGEVWGVYVALEARSQGIGSRLLEAIIDYARNELGLLQLHLEVISTNHAAVQSYLRIGFVRYGRLPRADILNGVEYDIDLMVLMLDGRQIADPVT